MAMTAEAPTSCRACGEGLLPDASFCERCGASAGCESPGPCRTCGADAGAIGADGYCTECGVRSNGRGDRVELDLGVAAGVSVRGRTHVRNDDAFYVLVDGRGVAAVVCDGVSTSASPDAAARVAADAAGAVLADALGDGGEARSAMAAAIGAAQRAVLELPGESDRDTDPACTLVSALWREGAISVGWVGDSRAYWIAGENGRQLTSDNSWAGEQVAAGVLTATEAEADPRARAITRWVGAGAPDDPPQIATTRPAEPGLLVLCSDGSWTYTPRPVDVARHLRQLPVEASPLAAARFLTDHALARGGPDDVTNVVVRIEPRGGRTT
jgi:PPM family protein phosphatase